MMLLASTEGAEWIIFCINLDKKDNYVNDITSCWKKRIDVAFNHSVYVEVII